MELFLRIDINIFSMILLIITAVLANAKLDKKDKVNQVFLISAIVISIEIFLETLTCIINGMNGYFFRVLSYSTHFLLFSIAPVLTYLWLYFIKFWVIPENKFVLKKSIIMRFPILVNFLLIILSLSKNIVFYLDKSNVYHRGPYFYIFSIITYYYIVMGFWWIVTNRKKIPRHEFIPLVFFGILPLIGGIVQSLFYKTLLMWSSCGFSLVIVYTFLQSRMINLDSLTGAWTRESFFDYFYQKIKHSEKEVPIIFIDMDNLKIINDRYGHIEGDFAIKKLAHLIKKKLKKTDIIARYGGDEFLLMLDNIDFKDIEDVMDSINEEFFKYNKSSSKGYNLEFSYGYGFYNKKYNSLEEFIHIIDKSMYQNKFIKKERVLKSI